MTSGQGNFFSLLVSTGVRACTTLKQRANDTTDLPIVGEDRQGLWRDDMTMFGQSSVE